MGVSVKSDEVLGKLLSWWNDEISRRLGRHLGLSPVLCEVMVQGGNKKCLNGLCWRTLLGRRELGLESGIAVNYSALNVKTI
jgi:hypothetical protein